MPQIPIYTAQGQDVRPRSPTYIPDAGYGEAQQRFGRQLEGTALGLNNIAAQVAAQRDDNEIINTIANSDAGAKEIHQKLSVDPEIIAHPEKYVEKFTEMYRDMIEGLTENASNDRVKSIFKNHIDREFPNQIIIAQGIGLKKEAQQANAGLTVTLDRLSVEAAQALSPEGRENAIQSGKNAINRYYNRGFGTDEERVKREKQFETNVLEKKMYEIARRQPDKLLAFILSPEISNSEVDSRKKTQALEAMRIADDRAMTRAKQGEAEAHKILFDNAVSLALDGQLDPSYIQSVKENQMPPLRPEDGLHFEKLQQATKSNAGDVAIELIAQHWAVSDRTEKDYAEARDAYRALEKEMADGGIANPKLARYANELESNWRARKMAEKQEINLNITLGQRRLEAARPGLPRFQYQLQKPLQ